MKKSVDYARMLTVCVVVCWRSFVIRDFLSRRWPKAVTRSEIGNFVGICTGSKDKLIQNRREKGNLIMGWSLDYQDFSQLPFNQKVWFEFSETFNSEWNSFFGKISKREGKLARYYCGPDVFFLFKEGLSGVNR